MFQNDGALVYPLYADLMLAPLALLSFPAARIIASVFLPIALVTGFGLWLRFLQLRVHLSAALVLALFVLTSYPVLEGLYAQQLSLLVAMLLAATALAASRGQMLRAGIFLGLASVKPQLIILPAAALALWALWDLRRRKNLMLGFLGTVGSLCLAAEAVLPGWGAYWIDALDGYRQYNSPPLTQFIFGTSAGTIVSVALVATLLVQSFRSRYANFSSSPFIESVSLSLAITVLVLPSSVAVYDHVLLFPAIFLLFSRRLEILSGGLPLRILGWVAAAVISWQWIGATGVVLASLVVPHDLKSTWILAPLRTAACVPFAVVSLLLFLIWRTGRELTKAKFLAPGG
ncbi:MAG TPA: glycosyltransferase 87 family protein [Terriglobales bacterium]|nr:glycosyltransferase 87 family protein [Terriglobales bacterium]